jgi:hypothetical protein
MDSDKKKLPPQTVTSKKVTPRPAVPTKTIKPLRSDMREGNYKTR